MPDYSSEIYVSPHNFVNDCDKDEIKELIDYLVEEGELPESVKSSKFKYSYKNDEDFIDNLTKLSKCRDLLTLEEENFINNLAEKFRHIR